MRLALRHIGVAVACSTEDHHQEIIAYCREKEFDGLLVRDADYVVFAAAAKPPRLFSASAFKVILYPRRPARPTSQVCY